MRLGPISICLLYCKFLQSLLVIKSGILYHAFLVNDSFRRNDDNMHLSCLRLSNKTILKTCLRCKPFIHSQRAGEDCHGF